MEPTAASPAPPRAFNWETLVPLLVDRVLRGQVGVSLLSYHLRKLTEVGALERVRQEQVRGAMQTFYALPAQSFAA